MAKQAEAAKRHPTKTKEATKDLAQVPGGLSISQGWCREFFMMNLVGDDNVSWLNPVWCPWTGSKIVQKTEKNSQEQHD